MTIIKNSLNLSLVLALSLLGPFACNNKKSAQEEETTEETQSDAIPARENRSVSGDTAFIKVFPDGEFGSTATTSSGTTNTDSSGTMSSASPAEETAASTPVTASPTEEAPSEEDPATGYDPATTTETQPSTQEPLVTDTTSSPTTDTTTVSEPTAPGPADEEETTPSSSELDDLSRSILLVSENSASQLIAVLPKENKAIVSIGKHNEFAPGAYSILAKWTADSHKVKVKVASDAHKEQDCAVDETATEGDWKSIGIFYLTKNAKVVIANGKNSSFSVKNELLLKPVIADNLTKPSKFKCLGGQINGHGLVGSH